MNIRFGFSKDTKRSANFRNLAKEEMSLVFGGMADRIVVPGTRPSHENDIWYGYDEGFVEDDTYGYEEDDYIEDDVPAAQDPDPLIEQQAREFAANAIVRGDGFDPNNPHHLEVERLAKAALEKLFIEVFDGNGSGIVTSTGIHLTEEQMVGLLAEELRVNLHADPSIPGFAHYIHDADPEISINVDHDQVRVLTSNFGTLEEAVNWVIAHELGHRIDHLFGDGNANLVTWNCNSRH